MAIPGLAAVSGFNSIKSGFNSLLGKAPPDRNASLRLRKVFKAAQAGDPAAIADLKRRATEQGSKFANINRKARKYYGLVTGGNEWASTPTAARGDAGTSSAASATPRSAPRDSAQPVPRQRAKPPCLYGDRIGGPDGPCPKRPRATSTTTPRGIAATPKGRRPCKYGDRVGGPDGPCPPRPRTSRTQQRAQRQLESAVTKGVTQGARRLAPLAVQYGPRIISFAAKAGLVLAAGAAAYWITGRIMAMRNATVQDLMNELSQASVQAKTAYREKYGREMSGSELTELRAWYRRKMEYLRGLGAPNKKIPFTVRFED